MQVTKPIVTFMNIFLEFFLKMISHLIKMKQNSTSQEGNIRHLVYLLENAIINLPKGQKQMSWLIDFTGWSMAVNPPMKTTREIIHILQNYYPERLGIAFLYNPPRLFQAVYRVHKKNIRHYYKTIKIVSLLFFFKKVYYIPTIFFHVGC